MDATGRSTNCEAEGALKAIGVGVNEWEVCHEALKQRDFDCFLLAGRYSLLEQEPLAQFLPFCVERNVSVVIGGGFNSGILATGPIDGSRYNYGPAPAHIKERVKRIEAVCSEFGAPLQAAAMQFVTAHPAVASLIIGARSPEQARQMASWFEKPIPAELWDALKATKLIRDDAPTPKVA